MRFGCFGAIGYFQFAETQKLPPFYEISNSSTV